MSVLSHARSSSPPSRPQSCLGRRANADDDAVVPLVADYYSTMEAAWVVLSVASTNASATKTITIADAYAAAVGRWADQMVGTYVGIYAGYTADMQLANAARTTTSVLANAAYQNAMFAAGATWLETALPAWVTYKDELSDHTVSWVVTSSLAWETCENDIADASLAYTEAATPIGTQLTLDMNGNYSEWVSTVATADETYGNELADHAVDFGCSVTSALESCANSTIVNQAGFAHEATRLAVLLAEAIASAVAQLSDFSWVERDSSIVVVDSVTASFWRAIATGNTAEALAIMEAAAVSGIQIAARRGVQAIASMLVSIYTKYPAAAMKCDEAARLAAKAFKALGQNPTTIRITDKFRAEFFFMADGKTRFSETGVHLAVLVNGRVYDALTGSAGMLYADYIIMLNKLNIIQIIEKLP